MARYQVPILFASLSLHQDLLPACAQHAHCPHPTGGELTAGDSAGGAAARAVQALPAHHRPAVGPQEEVRVCRVQVGVRPVRPLSPYEGGPPWLALPILSQALQKGKFRNYR